MDVAGRVMARRVFGKLAFFTLRDAAGDVQLYIEKARMANDLCFRCPANAGGPSTHTWPIWPFGSFIVCFRGAIS